MTSSPAAPLPFAIVDDERFDAHVADGAHPERPERLHAARAGLLAAIPEADRLVIDAEPVEAAELDGVHDATYVARLSEALAARARGHLDADTFFSEGTKEAAWRAAGGATRMARALMRGDARTGFALLRPPGHHAEPDRAMGFCLLNNVALAAQAALAAGAERVAIVDWDVHHGNGTQHAFEARSDVLFISLHQYPLYPGTGAPEETGRGAGAGSTVNAALPPGSDDAVYGEAFRRLVLPAIARHRPDVILVSAGYDAHAADPLASMELQADTYRAMASALMAAADDLGHGRVGFVLEGGYDLLALEASVRATAEAVRGARLALPEGALRPDALERIARAERALAAAAG
ncbi:MAG: histone deacetylase [Sandaracinaceae bacterium]